MTNGHFRRLARCAGFALLLVSAHRAFGQANGIYADFTTSMGSFTCRLEYAIAPKAVASFIGLATGNRPWLDLKTGNQSMPSFRTSCGMQGGSLMRNRAAPLGWNCGGNFDAVQLQKGQRFCGSNYTNERIRENSNPRLFHRFLRHNIWCKIFVHIFCSDVDVLRQ